MCEWLGEYDLDDTWDEREPGPHRDESAWWQQWRLRRSGLADPRWLHHEIARRHLPEHAVRGAVKRGELPTVWTHRGSIVDPEVFDTWQADYEARRLTTLLQRR